MTREAHGPRWTPLRDLVMTLRFFSRLPAGPLPHEAPDMGRMARVLPLAALLMGLSPGVILIVGDIAGLPQGFVAVLAVAAMVLVGGGMMEDAIADAADGLFGGWTRERRLEILKDSRHGTYGVAALVLLLLLRVAALTSIPSPYVAASIWLAANIAGRSGSLWLATALPPARNHGASASAGTLPARDFWFGAGLAAILVIALAGWVTGIGIVPALVAVALVTAGWAALCRRLVGGQTGDLIGAAGSLGEVAALTALLIFI